MALLGHQACMARGLEHRLFCIATHKSYACRDERSSIQLFYNMRSHYCMCSHTSQCSHLYSISSPYRLSYNPSKPTAVPPSLLHNHTHAPGSHLMHSSTPSTSSTIAACSPNAESQPYWHPYTGPHSCACTAPRCDLTGRLRSWRSRICESRCR